jgi:hypothetical protein
MVKMSAITGGLYLKKLRITAFSGEQFIVGSHFRYTDIAVTIHDPRQSQALPFAPDRFLR